MSSWIDVEANRKALQTELKRRGFYKGAIDGKLWDQSADAIIAFRNSIGRKPATSNFNTQLLDDLGLTKEATVADSTIISGAIATAGDYLLNFISSKINWAAIALVGLAVGWINTRFGINVPPDIQNSVTGWLITGGGALIVVLRTWFNKPKVIAGTTVTVVK